jgi:phage gp16-like protein
MTQRTRELAQIHVAIKQLGMNKDDHQALLQNVCGVSSAGDLDDAGRARYIAHLKKLGFEPRRSGDRAQADDARSRKIRALWLMLHGLGAVRNPAENALSAYVQRTVRVSALQWLNARQTETVIESLKKWAMPHLPDAVSELEQRLAQALRDGLPQSEAVIAAERALTRSHRYPSYDPMADAWEAARAALESHNE